jgi:hypothetical protein
MQREAVERLVDLIEQKLAAEERRGADQPDASERWPVAAQSLQRHARRDSNPQPSDP